jgi:hypothetical protein
MPITPLHYPFAYAISRLNRGLSLPGLVVGSFIPDIEVPFMWFFMTGVLPDHFILHSFIGAVTVGTLLSVIGVRFFYPFFVSRIFRIDRRRLEGLCQMSPTLVLSCLLGVFSHLLLDYPMHWYNPILWPWVSPFDLVGPLVALFCFLGPVDGLPFMVANLLVSVPMAIAGLIILVKHRGTGLWDSLLMSSWVQPATSDAWVDGRLQSSTG